jgi:hypothetical protein
MAVPIHSREVVAGSLGAWIGLLVGASFGIPSAASAAAELKINHFGTGAVAAYATCTPQPNGDEFCEQFVVTYGRAGSTRDGEAHSQPGVALEHFEAFIHSDGTATEVVETGFTEDVNGSYDRSHLKFARMGGATLALNDVDPVTGELTPNGRSATLGPFEWIAASGIHVFGNDGPFGFGLPRHVVDRCGTQIENAHAELGPAYLPWPGTGPDDARGAIFDNRFNVRIVSHGPGC